MGIGADGEISARIRAIGVTDFDECITSCGIAKDGGNTAYRSIATGDARKTATRRKHRVIHAAAKFPLMVVERTQSPK